MAANRVRPRSTLGLLAARFCTAAALLVAGGGLMACAQQTHQAGTADEALDEVRVIAAIARAQAVPQEASVCIARLVEGNPAFNALPTTDLAEIRARIRSNSAPDDDGPATSRTLDDPAIRAATDRVQLGPSCTGLTFLAFARIQFRGDVAVASALLTDGARCRQTGPVFFRLERADGRWSVAETLYGHMQSPIVCDAPTAETWRDYFAVGR